MKKILIILIFISGHAFAQNIPDLGFSKAKIVDDDKTIQVEFKPVKSDPDILPDRQYYWYGTNKIHITQGGFSGKLLNGLYSEYYPTRALKEQGNFKAGLKNGTWKSWNASGNLMEWATWKDGLKDGTFGVYDERGNLKQSGRYNDNLLDGQIKNYVSKDSVNIVKYDNGIAAPPKTKSRSFFKDPFKKKDKQNKPTTAPTLKKPTPASM